MGVMAAKRKSERPSVSMRTAEFTPRELPLSDQQTNQPRPAPFTVNPVSRRIREALRRWFEEEL